VTENPNEGIDLLNFAYLTTDVVLNLEWHLVNVQVVEGKQHTSTPISCV
jgi:hypothetical protein